MPKVIYLGECSIPISYKTSCKSKPSPNFGKNEYIYLSWKIDWIHNFYNSQPSNTSGFSVVIQNPNDEISPTESAFVGYKATFGGSLLLHVDFERAEDFGIVTGINLHQKSFTYEYKGSTNSNFSESFKLTSLGIPLYLKYGKNFFPEMRYLYLGAKCNFNLGLNRQANFNIKEKTRLDKSSYTFSDFSYSLGVNRKFINIKIEYQPSTVFRSNVDNSVLYPLFYNEKENYFGIKTSFNIPISKWTVRAFRAAYSPIRVNPRK